MEANLLLAERKLWIENSEDGSKKEIILRVGYPYWIVENEQAACAIEIYGMSDALQNHKLQDIQGVDFFQALELSLFFFNNFLINLPKNYKVYWMDGEPYEYEEVTKWLLPKI